MQAKASPDTPLGSTTAVKKNARWEIPEKTYDLSKNDPFGAVRKNRVCTHIYGARALKDTPAEHFRR